MVRPGILDEAQTLHVQGQFPRAETLYREVLESQPNAVRALEGLGVLLFQQGRPDEAATLFGRGVAIRPDSARLQANLGEALRTLKRHDLALDHLRKAQALDPALAQTWNSLGLLAYDQGRYAESEAAYQETIRLDPRFVAAYINLANVKSARHRGGEAVEALRTALRIEPDSAVALTNLGRALSEADDLDRLDEAEALCRRAVALAPDLTAALENLGNLLRLQGRLDEAMACYQQSLKRNPRNALARHNIGVLLQERGRYEEASRFYEAARSLQPGDPRYHADFGGLLAVCGRFDEAVPHYRSALACDPQFAEAHHGLGLALLEQGRPDLAEPCFREAVRIDPTLALAWTGLARLQAERGDFESSCRSARAALALRRTCAEAYWRLVINLKGQVTDAEVQAIERLLDQKYLPVSSRAMLHFCLGAVSDSRGLYPRAAAFYEAAHALQSSARAARGSVHDPGRHSRYIDRLIEAFTPEAIDRVRGWGDPDPRPIFVVGLPRSGTTLVEQILASHPQVHGAGELPDLHRVFQSLLEQTGQPSISPIEALNKLNPESAARTARLYLDRLDALAPPTAARVVDKMPDNIRLMGLIAMLWPNARVIVCGRDLRDVAISCWQTGFTQNQWNNDWDHLAQRFADHQRLLNHWRRTRPLEWLDLSYEDLVHDPEPNTRRLVEFAGLPWEKACLAFHSTRRIVRTASLVQVRQPIHSNSVGRWRRYEPNLQPLFQAFQTHGVELD